MSTFDGRVLEFPGIRIDYFRPSRDDSRQPLAYFLSHVHSDHLQGLETCKSPFIYCSPATREVLLKLEKYPHRMNFAKGILESRKQTYRHLKALLKPIPLSTPTTIELAPGRSVRATLFDANHCVGAVMFLIEDEKHAILYTGDIRSEKWWIDSLLNQPAMMSFARNDGQTSIKTLDCIYLDTTFASQHPIHRHFPSKAEGMHELLTKIAQYPPDTCFYLHAWTFGYEKVWLALSSLLNCRVHVDDYKYGVYNAMCRAKELRPEESSNLVGYYCGNHYQEGCITRSQTRLHSCEQGAGCDIFERDFVRITPVITRYQGQDVAELGAGGGHGDLEQQHELELGDQITLQQLVGLCKEKLQDSPELLKQTITHLMSYISKQNIPLDGSVLDQAANASGEHADIDDMSDLSIDLLVPAIVQFISKKQKSNGDEITRSRKVPLRPDGLPSRITFPYSRHASLRELEYLIEAFLPTEIYPCTVDAANWSTKDSMQALFAHLYEEGKMFRHDAKMEAVIAQRNKRLKRIHADMADEEATPGKIQESFLQSPQSLHGQQDRGACSKQNNIQSMNKALSQVQEKESDTSNAPGDEELFDERSARRAEAYKAALAQGDVEWSDIGLLSVTKQVVEEEL